MCLVSEVLGLQWRQMELYTLPTWAGSLLGALKVQLAGILASRVVYSTELMSHLYIYKVCNHQFPLHPLSGAPLGMRLPHLACLS